MPHTAGESRCPSHPPVCASLIQGKNFFLTLNVGISMTLNRRAKALSQVSLCLLRTSRSISIPRSETSSLCCRGKSTVPPQKAGSSIHNQCPASLKHAIIGYLPYYRSYLYTPTLGCKHDYSLPSHNCLSCPTTPAINLSRNKISIFWREPDRLCTFLAEMTSLSRALPPSILVCETRSSHCASMLAGGYIHYQGH